MMMNNPCEVEPLSRRKKLKVCPPSGLSLLPEEMVLSCLARISKSEHDSLSLVSKWHRSLLLTPELHNFRTLSGCTEEKLKHPSRTKSTLHLAWWHMVAGSTSWVVGLAEEPPRRVSCSWIVDPTRGSLSPPIYVFGGCDDSKSSKWGEVFDPKKQTWDALPMPPRHCSRPLMCEKIVIKEEKEMLAMTGTGQCLSYIPMYCSNSDGLVTWCEAHKWESPETEVVAWREVMGLEALRDTLEANQDSRTRSIADAMYDLITAVSVVCSFYNSFINSSALSLEFISVR
ncbi:hypothetical protein HID58_012880 [Brassica napus]|uniref:F-box domain-containing protein n=1 Tax=Brassica napus TaxID=3708 RepID=A0ABQ8E2S1_BRANA|nr:hypothetical protein HID58_012880 [Brassica napus]